MSIQVQTPLTVGFIAGAVANTAPLFKQFCCAICEDTGLVSTSHQNEAGDYLSGRCWKSCEASNSVVWSSEQEQWVKPSEQARFTLRKNEGSTKKPWVVEDTHADPAEDAVIYHFASKLKAERFKSDMEAEYGHDSSSAQVGVTAARKSKLVQPGGLNKRLIGTIQAATKTAEIATTCDWLVSEGYASDVTHARELIRSACGA